MTLKMKRNLPLLLMALAVLITLGLAMGSMNISSYHVGTRTPLTAATVTTNIP